MEGDRAKTDAGCRDIVLPNQAMATLKAIRRHNPFALPDAFLFQQKDGSFCTARMFNYRLKKACERADYHQSDGAYEYFHDQTGIHLQPENKGSGC